MRRYRRSEVISFLRTREEFGGLSNMAAGFTLNISGCLIWTSEALYQALKLPGNPEAQWEIRRLGIEMLRLVVPFAPTIFGDMLRDLQDTHPALFVEGDSSSTGQS